MARSDFKARREAGILMVVGLSHAEYVARSASWGVTDDDHSLRQQSIAGNPRLAAIPARVLDLDRRAFDDARSSG